MSMKRTTVDGKVVNLRTAAMLKRAQARLGEDLRIIQGSYNSGGVSASAGTHDGGGAIDVAPTSRPERVVEALRAVGFAAWHRKPSQGPWTEHIHAIAVGDPELSSGAAQQVTDYLNGRNGLAGHGPDDGPRFNPIPQWVVKMPVVSLSRIQNQFKADKPRKTLAVKRVQSLLNYRMNAGLLVDGIPGPKTKAAWKRWEQKIGVDNPDVKPGKYQLKKLFAGWYALGK